MIPILGHAWLRVPLIERDQAASMPPAEMNRQARFNQPHAIKPAEKTTTWPRTCPCPGHGSVTAEMQLPNAPRDHCRFRAFNSDTHPEGMSERSRGLSAATPPDFRPMNNSTPEGCQSGGYGPWWFQFAFKMRRTPALAAGACLPAISTRDVSPRRESPASSLPPPDRSVSS